MTETEGSTKRRSVLKSVAGVAGGAGITTSFSGSASAASTANIAVIMTQNYYFNYSGATSTQSDVKNYCQDIWNNTFDRSASFTMTTSPIVPEEELQSDSSKWYKFRVGDIDDWLQSNWDRYGDEFDAVLALDWLNEGGYKGYALQHNGTRGTAGRGDNITAAVNAWHEQGKGLPSVYDTVGIEGIALHEVGHLFDANHTDAEVMPDGRSSLMYIGTNDEEGQQPECNSPNPDVDEIGNWFSPCTIGRIRDHYDAQI